MLCAPIVIAPDAVAIDELQQPFVVNVHDDHGPRAGYPVTFTVVSGGGSLSGTLGGLVQPLIQTTTDAQGSAQVFWTLGGTVGTQSIIASAENALGSPISFFATATDAAPPGFFKITATYDEELHTANGSFFVGYCGGTDYSHFSGQFFISSPCGPAVTTLFGPAFISATDPSVNSPFIPRDGMDISGGVAGASATVSAAVQFQFGDQGNTLGFNWSRTEDAHVDVYVLGNVGTPYRIQKGGSYLASASIASNSVAQMHASIESLQVTATSGNRVPSVSVLPVNGVDVGTTTSDLPPLTWHGRTYSFARRYAVGGTVVFTMPSSSGITGGGQGNMSGTITVTVLP